MNINKILFTAREALAEILFGISIAIEKFLFRPIEDLQNRWDDHKNDIYWCPTQQSFESAKQGGFDVCCYHPELHRAAPDAR